VKRLFFIIILLLAFSGCFRRFVYVRTLCPPIPILKRPSITQPVTDREKTNLMEIIQKYEKLIKAHNNYNRELKNEN